VPEAQENVGHPAKFYSGKRTVSHEAPNRGDFVANRKTHAFFETAGLAYEWIARAALISARERAVLAVATAVVNGGSPRDEIGDAGETAFECRMRVLMSGGVSDVAARIIGDDATVRAEAVS
jgi:hypothetical protein